MLSAFITQGRTVSEQERILLHPMLMPSEEAEGRPQGLWFLASLWGNKVPLDSSSYGRVRTAGS